MRKIVLASHGDFATGLLSSVKMIVGELANGVASYGLYPGESAIDFSKLLENEIERNQNTEYVIITDLYGASVCSAMLSLCKYKNVIVISGLNINLVLELLLSYKEPLTDSSIEELIEKSRKGIKHVMLENNCDEEEDF